MGPLIKAVLFARLPVLSFPSPSTYVIDSEPQHVVIYSYSVVVDTCRTPKGGKSRGRAHVDRYFCNKCVRKPNTHKHPQTPRRDVIVI